MIRRHDYLERECERARSEYVTALADKEACLKKWARRDRIMNRFVVFCIASAAVSILLQVLQWCGAVK